MSDDAGNKAVASDIATTCAPRDASTGGACYVYPSASAAGMIAPPHSRQELVGAFVARHWCMPPPFGLTLRVEAAALAYTLASLPACAWGSLAPHATAAPVAAILRHRAPRALRDGTPAASKYRAREGGFLRPRIAPVQAAACATRAQLVAAGYMQSSLRDVAPQGSSDFSNASPPARSAQQPGPASDDSAPANLTAAAHAQAVPADAGDTPLAEADLEAATAAACSTSSASTVPVPKLAVRDVGLALNARDVLLSKGPSLRRFGAWCAATIGAHPQPIAHERTKRPVRRKPAALADAVRRLEGGLDFAVADVEGRAIMASEHKRCGGRGRAALAVAWRDLAALAPVRTRPLFSQRMPAFLWLLRMA